MKNKPMKFSLGNGLKLTLASSLIVLLGGCASSAASDSPTPQAAASTPDTSAPLTPQTAASLPDASVSPAQQTAGSPPTAMPMTNDYTAAQVAAAQSDANPQDPPAATARTAGLVSELKGLGAQRAKAGMVLTLGDRRFRHGHAQLLPGSEQNIAQLVDFFKQHPEVKAEINGYSDNAGSFNTTLKLSQERADAIASALVAQGVPAASLSTHAYGQIGWVASNKTTQGRTLNRRVEIVFDLAAENTAAQ